MELAISLLFVLRLPSATDYLILVTCCQKNSRRFHSAILQCWHYASLRAMREGPALSRSLGIFCTRKLSTGTRRNQKESGERGRL